VVDRGGDRHKLDWRIETATIMNVVIGEITDASPRQFIIRNGFITGNVER
jgi:hypothetical protein